MINFLGTIVNSLAIILGSIIGVLIRRGLPDKIKDTVMNGLALCVLFIGISGVLKGNNTMLIIVSIVIGGIIGEILDIDKALKKIGDRVENKFKGKESRISQAFVTSTLLFCVGSMAIVGSLESGLTGRGDTLYAKSILDGITSIIFSSTLGIGVIFSSVAVFLYQGLITLCASFLKNILIESAISNMTAVGSLLIIGLSLNMLGITKIKVANLLIAIFIPIIYQFIL
ncbi:hypothetical protein SAMN05443428_1317 [Caloramator quimbayensis]|uniref:Membrane protein YdfK n=1 Tax=Caloramator quimbayensis TaxID=1147123 RepID=A0A1T4YAF3_9CLOT|nr:DUF554 domain-containing protein [Caloramator quimbayensis]SKA98746.1 hypothetical protein SAMN05443428_1317 [Caloramator quimbayensis]